MCQTSCTHHAPWATGPRKATLTSTGRQARAERLTARTAEAFLNQNDRHKKYLFSLRYMLSF
jgi:hypothetical protein